VDELQQEFVEHLTPKAVSSTEEGLDCHIRSSAFLPVAVTSFSK
jgi:hypothetical protein